MRRLDDDGVTLLVFNEGGGGAKTDEDAATRRTPEVMAILKVLATGPENSFSGCSSGALLSSCSSMNAMMTARCSRRTATTTMVDGDEDSRTIPAGDC